VVSIIMIIKTLYRVPVNFKAVLSYVRCMEWIQYNCLLCVGLCIIHTTQPFYDSYTLSVGHLEEHPACKNE